MKKVVIILIISGLTFLEGFCQTTTPDSLSPKVLEEIVVTATRTERQLGSLTTPLTLIKKQQIQALGALRLAEVLQEQTGLAIISDHGQGIQMQGFDADYTLILIDGEPLIGRTAGTLALSRIAVNNIKQIEIVKGPSSSLYGSEALAGVINIITDSPQSTQGGLNVQYGANQTLNVNGQVSFKHKKLGVSLFADRYSSQGYDLNPGTYGATVEPFSNYTFQSKLQYTFNPDLKLTLSGRYYQETQEQRSDLGDTSPLIVSGEGVQTDGNFQLTLDQKIGKNLKLQYKLYHTLYDTESNLHYETDRQLYDQSFFKQRFTRPELVANYFFNDQHFLTLGVGGTLESVRATRYEGERRFNTQYMFGQYEWTPVRNLTVMGGARLDMHSVYGHQLSPKLSARYQITPWLAWRGSVGVGFKAPDFRQLYLNFTNTTVGYSVFGTEEVVAGVERFNQAGEILNIFTDPASFTTLNPERSIAYNFGIDMKWKNGLKAEVNLFRNDIENLIETQIVARKTNNQSIFSYLNLREVFTQGAEVNVTYNFSKNLQIKGGYQYLIAKDKAVMDRLDRGEIFKRDPQTLVTTRVTASEYGGLFNRSRHMANVRLFYTNKTITASLRTIYRGRYGLGDLNGNQILDADNEYVSGYWLWNTSVAKEFGRVLRFQVGVDNLLDFKNETMIPGIAGRLWYVRASFNFTK
ncbi:colicin I receptor [marine bacterium AO1-C]|nr:colicin I receptor [marine bacterium AO1-C]